MGTIALNKQRIVMHHVTFPEEAAPSDLTIFTTGDAQRNVAICTEDWEDMGSPDVVTVTVEPGDHLQDGAEDLDPASWVDHFIEWAEGREEDLDFGGAEVPTRVQDLLGRALLETIEDFQREIFEINTANGWFEDDRTVGDDLALLHSEVSEALEAFRSRQLDDVTESECAKHDHSTTLDEGQSTILCKPEGFGSELADVFVRLLDTCERRGIDLRFEIIRKLAYNRTRGHKHGGRAL